MSNLSGSNRPKKKIGIVIGRFQPVHNYHVECLLKPALEECDHVLVLLGSSSRARDIKNPFIHQFRSTLILAALGKVQESSCTNFNSADGTISFIPIKDYNNNSRWVLAVQNAVAIATDNLWPDCDIEVTTVLYGTDRDDTTWYLDLFPHYVSRVTNGNSSTNGFCATDIRNFIYANDWDSVARGCGQAAHAWLRSWAELNMNSFISSYQPTHEYLCAQNQFLINYKKGFETLKYPPIFQTVDNVCLWKDHVLLIKRGAQPGKGLWALPGGFMNADDISIRSAALRELDEETRIQFYTKAGRKAVLKAFPSWMSKGTTFDKRDRSLRGRTITTAFRIDIPSSYNVVVKAADDAADAQWFPLSTVLNDMDYQLFEDHQSIIANLTIGSVLES